MEKKKLEEIRRKVTRDVMTGMSFRRLEDATILWRRGVTLGFSRGLRRTSVYFSNVTCNSFYATLEALSAEFLNRSARAYGLLLT